MYALSDDWVSTNDAHHKKDEPYCDGMIPCPLQVTKLLFATIGIVIDGMVDILRVTRTMWVRMVNDYSDDAAAEETTSIPVTATITLTTRDG